MKISNGVNRNLKFFLISLILSLPFFIGINISQENLEKFFYAQISQPFEEITFVKIPQKPKKPELELEAKSAISIRITAAGREKILFKKDFEKLLPIASLTKLMTGLIVLEDPENYNFSRIITISKEAALKENVPENGNLKSREKKTVGELLNLMLIYSSNDATWALAEVIEADQIVEKMNQRAKSLNLENTHFINPSGLDPENLIFGEETNYFFNYSTAKDLARLAQYILNEFPLIFEISSNRFSDLSLKGNTIGGKTGYTIEAGGCMLLVLENEGNYFINIILGANGIEGRLSEMKKLIDWLEI